MRKNQIIWFWNFYKWQIMTAAIVMILGIYLLCTALIQKDCVLSVMLFDCHTSISQDQAEREIFSALQLDEERYTVSVQNELMISDSGSGSYAMTSLSRFLTDVGSEKLDVCGMLEEDFLRYDASHAFLDLRECLDEQQLQKLENNLLVTNDGRVIGVYADELPGMLRSGCYATTDSRGVIGIIYNTKHKEIAGRYLMYLTEH